MIPAYWLIITSLAGIVGGAYIGWPVTRSQERFWYNAGWNDALSALEPDEQDQEVSP